ncbi:arginine deiminase-related protein [Pseudoxanthomonas sp. F37]|uniref:arginine deiminase-related protein n=1 Tax=Pseudoxanthomonas sp. F37 TaxID=2932492 RepID=UPI001FD4C912|nr:arginine deiminase-related protein [Pseudoxanthomonas sp. F37]UOV08284.1 arginine deiminase-related protein [Pseudoxanthomonas sp. F37]
MITRDIAAFTTHASMLAPDFGAATARAAFLVSPEGFMRAEQSAQDNRYMAGAGAFDAEAALREHRALHRALSQDVPVVCFPGDPATPDAVFPNNVFATARVGGEPRLIVGRMRHPVRQREAARPDIRGYFRNVLGYAETDLSGQPHPCELTGALVIDRARGIGFCGLSERCDEAGAALMHAAFGLRATLMFDLAPGEYHTNVLLAVLAGRAALVCPHALQGDVSGVLHALYGPHVVVLSPAEQAAFAGNAIALTEQSVWMSRRAREALHAATLAQLEAGAAFAVRSVPLEAIEAGGGSLRCCVAEIF